MDDALRKAYEQVVGDLTLAQDGARALAQTARASAGRLTSEGDILGALHARIDAQMAEGRAQHYEHTLTQLTLAHTFRQGIGEGDAPNG